MGLKYYGHIEGHYFEDFFLLCDSFRLSQIRLKFDSGHVTYVDCSVIRGRSVIRGQYWVRGG